MDLASFIECVLRVHSLAALLALIALLGLTALLSFIRRLSESSKEAMLEAFKVFMSSLDKALTLALLIKLLHTLASTLPTP